MPAHWWIEIRLIERDQVLTTQLDTDEPMGGTQRPFNRAIKEDTITEELDSDDPDELMLEQFSDQQSIVEKMQQKSSTLSQR